MSELAAYLRPPDRSWCCVCRRSIRRLWVDGWNVTVRCHGREETRTLSLAFIEDNPKKIIAWFAVKPAYELVRFGIDRHGRTQDSTGDHQ